MFLFDVVWKLCANRIVPFLFLGSGKNSIRDRQAYAKTFMLNPESTMIYDDIYISYQNISSYVQEVQL